MKTDCSVILWQGQKESNPRHAVLETAALPAELCPYLALRIGECLDIIPNLSAFVKGVSEKKYNLRKTTGRQSKNFSAQRLKTRFGYAILFYCNMWFCAP